MKYKCHSHFNLNQSIFTLFVPLFDGGCGEKAASDQNIEYEVIENDSFEIMNMSQMRW